MKKAFFYLLVFVVTLIAPYVVKAGEPDEGMWLPMYVERLNYVDMQKMGLHLTAEELYSVNQSCLKDAIVQLGNFCTAEVISEEGLLLTNHHCGYSAIQSHSTVENDYLTNGFWAMNRNEELENKDLTATFLVRMEDVTSKVLAEVDASTSDADRAAKTKKVMDKLKKEASDNDKYEVSVKSFFNGNEYYLFVYKVYKDIRLVGAPPSSVGKFGGDTDNWMWPRHTGDFSMFRIYTAPDGSPAVYSKENIPLKPKHSLPISLKGVKKGDFSMIWGFPGKTDRYLPSEGVNLLLEHQAPTIIKLRDKKLAIMKEDMNANDAIRIKYSAKYAQTSNYWKYFIGQSKGLKKLKVYDKKKAIENDFDKWIGGDVKRYDYYKNVLPDIASAYKEYGDKKYEERLWYFQEMFIGAEVLYFVYKESGLEAGVTGKDIKPESLKPYRDIAAEYFKDYNLPTDKKIFIAMMKMYQEDIPSEYLPDVFTTIKEKYKGNIEKYADELYKKSIFASQENFDKFLAKPSVKTLKKDIGYITSNSVLKAYIKLGQEKSAASQKLKTANRLFVEGLMKMKPDFKFYPDANSTMRMTYGQVLDYFPTDAVYYNYYTTINGIMEKEDAKNDEIVVPEKLKQLYEKKDYGQYGENGTLNVCFISNTDITGGNSGSPVINGDGQLIGIAFDGNWEAMSGDIAYEPSLQRTISVDIRYVLFMVDKYAGAGHLVKEMNIVR